MLSHVLYLICTGIHDRVYVRGAWHYHNPLLSSGCVFHDGGFCFRDRARNNKMQNTKLSKHKELINFFSDMALATRGFRPVITARDAHNLKRVMDLNILDQSRMQQLMLYFLADKNYKNLGPSIATIFSATILNSLRNATLNRAKFYKELDEYTTRYINKKPIEKRAPLDDEQPGRGAVSMASLLQNLSLQMKLDKSTAPRAPVRTVADKQKSKLSTLF